MSYRSVDDIIDWRDVTEIVLVQDGEVSTASSDRSDRDSAEEGDEDVSHFSRSSDEDATLEAFPESSSDSHYSDSSGEPKPKVAKLETPNDSGVNCPICFDPWNNSGEHRLVSLKCGHLFGNSCISKWIGQQKVCPTCKARSTLRDIRYIYAKQVECVDNSEIEAVRQQLEQEREGLRRKELEIQRLAQAQVAYVEKIQQLTSVIENYMNPQRSVRTQWKFTLENNTTVSEERTCRVFAYNAISNALAFSLQKLNTVFLGYSVQQMFTQVNTLGNVIIAHSREIRCMEYSHANRLLMTVSLDKNISLIDLEGSKKISSIATVGPLWSCCWDRDNSNRLFVGTSTGRLIQFDIRQTKAPLLEMSADSDLSPVISLACVPGGLISCQLNSLKTHRWHRGSFLTSSVFQRGPYLALNYDRDTGKAIVSTRPNSLSPHCKHLLYDVDMIDDNSNDLQIVHEYVGSTKQTVMTKVSQYKYRGESMMAAFNESEGVVQTWNTGLHAPGPKIPSSEGILDTCPWTHNDAHFLSILSQKKIRTYKIVDV